MRKHGHIHQPSHWQKRMQHIPCRNNTRGRGKIIHIWPWICMPCAHCTAHTMDRAVPQNTHAWRTRHTRAEIQHWPTPACRRATPGGCNPLEMPRVRPPDAMQALAGPSGGGGVLRASAAKRWNQAIGHSKKTLATILLAKDSFGQEPDPASCLGADGDAVRFGRWQPSKK